MELTPIRIPGKYKRTKTKAATEARKALNRKPGRPPKRLQDVSSKAAPAKIPSAIQTPKKRSLKTIKSKRKMSLLEKLPTELLERVFRFCLNLNLPNTSPVIAGKLSSVTVYNWTMMRVFGPSWERGYARERSVGRKDVGQCEAGEAGEGDEDEDGEMQSQVLRCRWASLEVLLRAKEAWIQKYEPDRAFKPLWFLKEKNIMSTPPPSDPNADTLNNDTADLDNTPPPAQPPPPPPRLTPAQFLAEDYSSFLSFSSQPDGSWPWHTISWTSYSDVSPTLEIPHSLLSSPFTPSTLTYLFHLLKSGARVSLLSSTSGEVAVSGLQAAIKQGNVEAIHLLIWSGLAEMLDVKWAVWTLRNAGPGAGAREGEGVEGRARTVNQVMRLGFTVLEGRERGRIEAELLEMRDEAVMAEDEEGLEFVRRVVQSKTLRGKVHVKV